MLGLKDLEPCPLNRDFPVSGKSWEEFVESVRRDGVMVPLVVRPRDGGFHEVLAGNRRLAAAAAAGSVKKVPCLVRGMDDREALLFVIRENLERLNPDPVDEGRLLKALAEETGETAAVMAARICRSVEWVRTRQCLLDLGDEVCAAVRSKDPDRHLTLGSVEEILRVPEGLREQAVQLVLHPSFDTAPLRPEKAREYLRECLVKPAEDAGVWKAAEAGVCSNWKARLRELVKGDLADGVSVCAAKWEERAVKRRGAVNAEEKVPLGMCAPSAPDGVTWAGLAARHGLVMWVVPVGDSPEMSEALVSRSLIELGERELAGHGGTAWLALAGGVERDAKVAAAVKDLDDPGHAHAEDEEPETVIEQRMEWVAAIDMGKVKAVAEWLSAEGSDPMDAPDFIPPWARTLAIEGMWDQAEEACKWVMGLRRQQGEG